MIANRPQVEEEARYEPVRPLSKHERERGQQRWTYVDSMPRSALVTMVVKERGSTRMHIPCKMRTMVYRAGTIWKANSEYLG